MTQDEFSKILESRIAKMRAVLDSKSREYSHGGDKLYNFKAMAGEFGGTPESNLWGLLKKQLLCVLDIVEDRLPVNRMTIDEKIGDSINYLVLLEALFLEIKTKEGSHGHPVDPQQLFPPEPGPHPHG